MDKSLTEIPDMARTDRDDRAMAMTKAITMAMSITIPITITMAIAMTMGMKIAMTITKIITNAMTITLAMTLSMAITTTVVEVKITALMTQFNSGNGNYNDNGNKFNGVPVETITMADDNHNGSLQILHICSTLT